jgi:hypothetical protein
MATVNLRSARTAILDPGEAAEALCKELAPVNPKLVTLFASSLRDQVALNRAMRERLPKGTRLIGATTAGEIDNEGMHQGTVVASVLEGDLEVGIGLGKGLGEDAVTAGAKALASAAEDLGVRPSDLGPTNYVGLVMDDGFRNKKEELLLGVLDRCPALMLVGGGAAYHDIFAPEAHGTLHADGDVASNAVLVTLVKTKANIGALRSHWYTPTGQTVQITKVDESCTRALEIDGKPAAARYAELLGVRVDELQFGTPRGFAFRPTALKVGREHFIRAPFQPLPDGSILFVNLLDEGVELELMQLGDPADDGARSKPRPPSSCSPRGS